MVPPRTDEGIGPTNTKSIMLGNEPMLNKQDAQNLFELVHTDAQSWLAQARQLRIAADVIFREWQKVIRVAPSGPGVQEHRLAYSQTFMLLTGFAFENLLKGILYGRNPKQNLKTGYGGSHGIVKMANEVGLLSSEELDLLERLERYLVWAGRYQLPTTAKAFHDAQGKISITTHDPKIIEPLFERLERTLDSEWRARGNY
jgi:hypothetical protein